MSTHLDLFDDAWIGAVYTDGTRRQIGVRQAMIDASRIWTLEGEDPMVTVALHRLLLAVAQRLVGRFEADEWPHLWERGLPLEGLEAIGEGEWELFPADGGAGFAQDPVESTTAGVAPLTAWADRGAAGGVLWHPPQQLTMAEAARWLVWCHAYDTGGIRSSHFQIRDAGVPIGPAGAAPYTLMVGATLSQTLLLNLTPGAKGAAGRGWWERTTGVVGRRKDQTPEGMVDLLCWPTRRIRLHLDEDGLVCRAVVTGGDDIKNPDDPGHGDHQVYEDAYRHVTTRSLAATLPGLTAPAPSTGRKKAALGAPGVVRWFADRHHGLERVTVSTTTVIFGGQLATFADVHTREWVLPATAVVPGTPAHERVRGLMTLLGVAEQAAHHLGLALAPPSGSYPERLSAARVRIHRDWSGPLETALRDLDTDEGLEHCRQVLLSTVQRHLDLAAPAMRHKSKQAWAQLDQARQRHAWLARTPTSPTAVVASDEASVDDEQPATTSH